MAVDKTQLVETYRDRIFYFGLRRLRDRRAAEELVQEVILRALEALEAGRLEDENKLGSFVFGIALNRVKEEFRERSRLRAQTRVEDSEQELPWLADPEAETIVKEERRQVREALRQLSTKDREVLTRCFYDPLPLEELAREMGVSYAALRKRKSRALERLRQIMKKSVTKSEHFSLID